MLPLDYCILCGAIQYTFYICITGKSRPSHKKIETKMDWLRFLRIINSHRASAEKR